MPILFSKIAYDLQIRIANKMEHTVFTQFERSSKSAKNVAEGVVNRIVIGSESELYPEVVFRKVLMIPFVMIKKGTSLENFDQLNFSFRAKMITIYSVLDDEVCQELIAFFKKTQAKANMINFNIHFSGIACSATLMSKLLEEAQVEHFKFRVPGNLLSIECIRTNAMRMMKSIFASTHPLNDDDILALEAESISLRPINDFTGHGINKFLWQYIRGTRNIREVVIYLNEEPFQEDMFLGIEHECKLESEFKKDYEISLRGRKLNIWIAAEPEKYITFFTS